LQEWNDNLIAGMKSGESVAFEQCYRILSPIIYTAILKICRNRECANDLLHDTFLDAFDKIATFNNANSFIAWLKRIAFNNTFNYLKKEKRKFQLINTSEDTNIEVKTIAESHGDNNLINKLMASVPTAHRVILWLFIVEQYSHDEIAVLVNKSASYSKSIVSRSLSKLKAQAKEMENAYC